MWWDANPPLSSLWGKEYVTVRWPVTIVPPIRAVSCDAWFGNPTPHSPPIYPPTPSHQVFPNAIALPGKSLLTLQPTSRPQFFPSELECPQAGAAHSVLTKELDRRRLKSGPQPTVSGQGVLRNWGKNAGENRSRRRENHSASTGKPSECLKT